MSETLLSPQFTFSPEGELVVSTRTLSEGPNTDPTDAERLMSLDRLGELPGVTTDETSDVLTAHIDIAECLGDNFDNTGDPQISGFFRNVRSLLPGYMQDDTDRVLSVNHLHDNGLTIVVNEHFQRWLNQQGFTEEVARDTIKSMSLPFGEDSSDRATKDFNYRIIEGVGELVMAGSFSVTTRNNEFGLMKEDSESFKEASVAWKDTIMSTLGPDTFLGVDAVGSDELHIQEGVKQLYEMGSTNIDFARQSLSLFLGLGTMAYHAVRYEGAEDILAGVVWED